MGDPSFKGPLLFLLSSPVIFPLHPQAEAFCFCVFTEVDRGSYDLKEMKLFQTLDRASHKGMMNREMAHSIFLLCRSVYGREEEDDVWTPFNELFLLSLVSRNICHNREKEILI